MKRITDDNIEIVFGYDYDLANIEYDNFLENLPGYKFYKDHDVLVIGDLTNKHFKKWKLQKMKKADLLELYLQINDCYGDDYTKKELINELMNTTHEEYYNIYCRETYFHNIECDFIITGYSQGDYKKVVIIDGTKDVGYINKELLKNIFYDTPFTVSVKVDDENIYIDEYLDDLYNVNEDDIINAIDKINQPEEIKSKIKQLIEENISL